jgi:1-acyl-sn-glycerol-3-phosphate acyltransferase
LDEAVATVSAGAIAGIFPEGTVNPPGGPLLRGRTGVARIALAAGAPVIPVGMWGTQVRWPRSGLTFRRPLRPSVALTFGPPIEPKGDPSSLDDIQAFTTLVMKRIAEQVAAARNLAEGPGPTPG